jgi:hypothetical protein
MSAVYKYRLYCIEEGIYVETWSETEPTMCPNDHGDRTINSGLTTIIESREVDPVIATENSVGDFETTHIKMDIPSGTPGEISEHDVVWPMDILLWRTLLTPTSDMTGDEITVTAAPETTVGALTATSGIGTTVFNVNPESMQYYKRGYVLTLDDTINKESLGRIINIDSIGNTVTTENATTFSFNAGTMAKISIYILRNIYIHNTNVIDIGSKGMKGKMVPAGTILRVYYTNNSGTSKTFRWRPEYYNDG